MRKAFGRVLVLLLSVACPMGSVALAQLPKAPALTPPGAKVQQPSANPVSSTNRPVAYVYDNIPVTMDEFGKYLMDRGGAEKLEMYVNKRIIELEAQSRKITVTRVEMEAALAEDLQGISVSHDDFLKILLPKYGKTLYEWMEDVIRPRLLLSKMCQTDVKVTDADLMKQFERVYGEKRKIQMIMWPKTEARERVAAIRGRISNDADEYDSMARTQANPSLAASKGVVKPISRHLPGEDKRIEDLAFKLKKDEVSEILLTEQGYVVIKLLEVIPANKEAKFETEKAGLFKAAFEELLALELPKHFEQLRARARPSLLYTGPTDWQDLSTVKTTTPSITTPGSGGSPTIVADPSVGQQKIQQTSGVEKK